MTALEQEQLELRLRSTGYPVAYQAFRSPQKMPFICWQTAYSNNFAADGIVYRQIDHIQIELYTPRKDQEAESRMEQALASYFWEKSEAYIESENAMQVVYEIEV